MPSPSPRPAGRSGEPRTAGAADAPLVVAALRTPLARSGTLLALVPVHELLAPVLRSLVDRTGVPEASLADVIVGNAAGGGGNLARLAALTAGLPQSLPGITVDRQCGSGLDAIVLACRLAASGAGGAYLAGGAESISTAPVRGRRQPDGTVEFYRRAQHAPVGDRDGDRVGDRDEDRDGDRDGDRDQDRNHGGADGRGDPDMGFAAETVAREAGVTRERQDALALRSHVRALAATASGAFDGELVPVRVDGVADRSSGGGWVRADNGPRPRLDARLLARFPAAFVEGGTVTAGNSCFDADGAAGVLVVSPEAAAGLPSPSGRPASGGRAVLAFLGAQTVGVDPRRLGLGAAAAAERLLAGLGVRIGDVAAIEFNEAFAGQVLACTDRLGLRGDALDAVLNTDGGALALGHAYGASGAVSVVRLLARSQALPEGSLCLAMISSAGGLGTAALFEARRLP